MQPSVIVALDYNDFDKIERLVCELEGWIDFYKVGLEAFVSIGPRVLEFLKERNKKIFLDLKLHDIPNTVSKAVTNALKYDVDIISLHIQGGYNMIKEAKKAVDFAENCAKKPLLAGVTLLTSLDSTFIEDYKISVKDLSTYVGHLAKFGKDAGLNCVIASVGEAPYIREICGEDFKIISPGIRLVSSDKQDQKRVYTPLDAKKAGINYIVVGRLITTSNNKINVINKIFEELND